MNKLVSSSQIIADIKDELGPMFIDSVPMINRFIAREIKKVVGKAYLTACISVETVDGCNLVLPDCAVLFEGAIWGDHGCECNNLFKNFSFQNYRGSQGVRIGNLDTNTCVVYPSKLANGVLQFMYNYHDQKITVKTWGWQKDDCGHIMIPELLIDYCIAVVKYKMIGRKMHSGNTDRFIWNLYKEAQRLLDLRYKEAIGNSVTMDDDEYAEIVDVLNDPLSGNPFPNGLPRIPYDSNLLMV
jgi:hypothetical protein